MSNNSDSNPPADSKISIANEVDKLILDDKILERFRQMITEFGVRNKRHRKESFEISEQLPDDGFITDNEPTPKHPDPWPWTPGNEGRLNETDMMPGKYLLVACYHDYCLYGNTQLIITDELTQDKMTGLSLFQSSETSMSAIKPILDDAVKAIPVYIDDEDQKERENRLEIAWRHVQQDIERIKTNCRHSPDFRSVVWFGTEYKFTGMQSDIVEILWEAWENRTPNVGEAYLLQTVGSDGKVVRVKDIFKKHPAYNKMLGSGGKKGLYHLIEPAIQ